MNDVDNHIRGIYCVDVPPGLDFLVLLRQAAISATAKNLVNPTPLDPGRYKPAKKPVGLGHTGHKKKSKTVISRCGQ